MSIQESGEMYIENIYVLTKQNDKVRSIDVCERMGYSKPSVSRAIGILKRSGYIEVDPSGYITLTESGINVAERIYERHKVLTERSNEQTLRTAEWLESNGKPFWLRYVLVPGYSAIEEDIRALGTHFGSYKMLQRVEILPYHTLGVHKYAAMGQEYKLAGVRENSPEQLDEAKALFDEYFPTVYVN